MTEETKPKARSPRKEKVVSPISQPKVKLAEQMRNVFATTVPMGVTKEDIQDGKYWINLSKTVQISSRIEVTTEDGSYYAELYITHVGLNTVKVKLIRYEELTDGETIEDAESEFEVKYRGQVLKHAVQYKADKKIIKSDFPTASEAKQWLLNYETGLTN